MNEPNKGNYSFCPKCGALMEEGICPDCAGEEREKGVYSSKNVAEGQASAGQDPQREEKCCGSCPQDHFRRQPYQGGTFESYHPYKKPQKDSHIWIIIAAAAAVLILVTVIAGSFFYGYFLMKLIQKSSAGLQEEWNITEQFPESDMEEPLIGQSGAEESSDEYVPSPEDEYYYGPCDSINTNVPYSFISKSYSNEDEENSIDIIINYLELKSENIPNLEQLNQELESQALFYAEDFVKGSYYAEYGKSFSVYITSYVTYNDDEVISIVLDEYVAIDELYHVDLYPINIDVKNGVILDNGSLLQIDKKFAEEFRKRNNKQNGNLDYLDAISDEEIADQLQDKSQVIAYYTPLGMEIGLNYSTDSIGGWFTVTYKDYQNYLKKF